MSGHRQIAAHGGAMLIAARSSQDFACWWRSRGPPLYTRLEKENRLDNSDEAIRRGSNVIPKQLSTTQLLDGCAVLMRDLYTPAAYFDRLDKLYLEGGLRPSAARSRYLRHHPIRALAANVELLSEALVIIWHLMRRIPDAALRREYRQRLWRAFKRRPEPVLLRVYALKCALHFHAFMMAQQMMSCSAAAENEGNEYRAAPLATAAEPMRISA